MDFWMMWDAVTDFSSIQYSNFRQAYLKYHAILRVAFILARRKGK